MENIGWKQLLVVGMFIIRLFTFGPLFQSALAYDSDGIRRLYVYV